MGCGCGKSHVAQLAEGSIGQPMSLRSALTGVHGGMSIVSSAGEWPTLRPLLAAQLLIWAALNHPATDRLASEIARLNAKFGGSPT